jgi:hypothetical protein
MRNKAAGNRPAALFRYTETFCETLPDKQDICPSIWNPFTKR